MMLAPNAVAWATGDAVEEPHYYQQRVAADAEYITQYVPRPWMRQSAGKYYEGTVGPQLVGWEIGNEEAATDYIGAGGTHNPPTAAYSVAGYWLNDFMVEPGAQSVISVGCGARGCDRWDTQYALWSLQSQTGTDTEQFFPGADILTWNLKGTPYTMTPTSFTAGTINVGTLNATTINSGVAASAIAGGTLSVSVLPLFGASGVGHAVGAVPDPGATAGATRYLREDGTWSVPAGGSGSNANLAGGAAYTIPYQTAAGATSQLSSPTVNGTYFLTETPTASVAAAPAWTNAATYMASPPAIGETTPAGGTFSALNVTANTVGTMGMQVNNSATGIAGYSYGNSGGTQGIFGFNTDYTGIGASVGSFFFMGNGVPICFMVSVTGNCVEKIAASGVTSFTGAVTMPQVVVGGATPTMVAGTGAGSSANCTAIAGANMAGVIACTTGTGTAANATLATITFNGALATEPQGCMLMPRNAAAAAATTTVYTTTPSTAGWTIAIGGTALSASTAYSWSYDCM